MTTHRILVSDPLEKTGLGQLRASGHDVVELPAEDKAKLPDLIGDFDALVVRSGTKVTADLLRAGKENGCGTAARRRRAGIGVDNVDTQGGHRAGHPGGQRAHRQPDLGLRAHLRAAAGAGAQRRRRRRRHQGRGVEPQEVGRRRAPGQDPGRHRLRTHRPAGGAPRPAFDMEVLAHDPFLPDDVVASTTPTPLELDELLARADVVTLHVPLTDETRNMLSASDCAR